LDSTIAVQVAPLSCELKLEEDDDATVSRGVRSSLWLHTFRAKVTNVDIEVSLKDCKRLDGTFQLIPVRTL
jgi:hypothetical protein